MNLIVFDTSVLVDDLRTGCHAHRIQNITGFIRYSSVVLAELLRGATTSAERELIADLGGNNAALTPTEKNWLESGEILSRMRADLGFRPSKLRDLHFDVLIALTARSHGARLITSNRADFQAIQKYRKFDLEVW
jgi:predicted nucleic acid-binding protein